MEYSFLKINIQSPFPTTACGHSCQTVELFDYHDPLFARVFSFRDDDLWLIHFSFDLLAFDLEHRNQLEDYFRSYYHDDRIKVITSTTHTHYANSVRGNEYVDYLCDLLKKEVVKMEYRPVNDVRVSYQKMHSTAVGKSRISGYETDNETLGLIRFYEEDKNFFNIIYYNCHPTILEAHTPYFSSEYPGYVLAKLEEKMPDTDFTFLQGAAGDISSRFVRDGQDYEALTKLGNNLLKDIESLMNADTKKVPLNLTYTEKEIVFEHEFTPIDLSKIRADLTDRELETIRLGQIEREKLEKKNSQIFDKPIDKGLICAVDFGPVRTIFFPNEIFSEYINYTNKEKDLLVSYSNGYGPYVLPIDFSYITYEMFTDTMARSSKEEIIHTLKTI